MDVASGALDAAKERAKCAAVFASPFCQPRCTSSKRQEESGRETWGSKQERFAEHDAGSQPSV